MIWLVLSHNNVVYTFTDKRIIIRSGLIGIDYQIIDYDKIYFMQVNINPLEKLFDVGSILFNIGIVANNSVMPKRFCGIENPCEVLRRIKEISLDSNTDLNHPNTNRPENNTN
ncbi:MAG: PH domain-containing protein [Planctomycetaceae bacterium]|nr:PH domain-containing protein [Planctomycetaceae bacterium]